MAELERLQSQRRAAAEAAARARAEAEARRAEEEARRKAELDRLRAAEAARQAAAAAARRAEEEAMRRKAEQRRAGAVVLQAATRGQQCRFRVGPRPEAARAVQRAWRGGTALKRARTRRAAEADAAPRLQALARGALLRRRLSRRLAAAKFEDSDSELDDIDDLLDDGWMAAAAQELNGYFPPPRAAPLSAHSGGLGGRALAMAMAPQDDGDDDEPPSVPYRLSRPAGAPQFGGAAHQPTSPLRAPLRPAAAAAYVAAATDAPLPHAARSPALTGGAARGGFGGAEAGVAARAGGGGVNVRGGYAVSEGGESSLEVRRDEARERMMSEWGLSDVKTADLLLRRKNRMGAQRKKADKRRELQDPLRRLEHAQQLSRAWVAPDETLRRGPASAAAAGGNTSGPVPPARRSRHVVAQGQMWPLGRAGDAGGSGAVDEPVLDDLEVASVGSAHSDLAPRRSDSPLRSFTSAAPNGKLARLAQRLPVPLHQQRIGWE